MNPHDRLLLDAARSGDADAVRAAVGAGAAPDVRDEALRTPLLLASLGDHVAAAEALVAAGADPDAPDSRQDTPWLVTGVTGSVAMARVLLAAGPDLRRRNRFGGVSLIPAAERGHVEYTRFLLAETAIAVDHVNDLGWTALLEAAILGDGGPRHREVTRLLLAAGADPLLPDRDGVTAHAHAVARGFEALAAVLRDAGGAPDTDTDTDAGTGGDR
ncbi:ankyrin repeat domain-containing protein (plasmid) [Streptomyces sp. BI20]|uniref:ankyrin repeat domain-containing protein n=1 Tax=Streptomyces sp. BI20 TaxID=3403460 RepID=UPI003C71A45C